MGRAVVVIRGLLGWWSDGMSAQQRRGGGAPEPEPQARAPQGAPSRQRPARGPAHRAGLAGAPSGAVVADSRPASSPGPGGTDPLAQPAVIPPSRAPVVGSLRRVPAPAPTMLS